MLPPPDTSFVANPSARHPPRVPSDHAHERRAYGLLARCSARRLAPRAAKIWIFAATLLFTHLAQAQRIILLCPPEADTSLTEAFNRLRGELSMHGFEVEIQTSAEAISPESLALRADSAAAVASVAFVRSAGGYATADIKISDRVTGKTTTRTIATPEGSDAASLLALRAVELLRASLREFGPTAKAPKDIVGAAPERASPSVKEFAEQKPPTPPAESPPAKPPAPAKPRAPIARATTSLPTTPSAPSSPSIDSEWSLRADALAAEILPGAHTAYGAGLTLGYRPIPHLELQLGAEAPWYSAQYSTTNAKSEVHLFTAAGGLGLFVQASRYAELQITGGLGLTRMTLFTTTVQPLLPMLPSAWVVMPRLAAGVSVRFSTRFFWQTNVMIAALLPPARLHLENDKYTVGLPILQLSSGLGTRF